MTPEEMSALSAEELADLRKKALAQALQEGQNVSLVTQEMGPNDLSQLQKHLPQTPENT